MRFHMPPEWAYHQRMFMEWPVPDDVWRENIGFAREAFAQTARAISRFEPVTMIVNPGEESSAHMLCGSKVEIVTIPHDDCWMRDNGCTFVINKDDQMLHGVHWRFNAWGGKYPNLAQDANVPSRLCAMLGIPEYCASIILEGGAIHTNGHDTLLTTAECLLNPNRNPGFSRDDLSKVLSSLLGVSRVIFLPFGIACDETDGHVDNIACFIDENTVLLPKLDDIADANYDRIEAARLVLDDAGFTICDIVHPPLTLENGQPLALSYINFVFVNGGIVMPGFGGELSSYDARAKEQLSALFPNREVVQIMTRDISRGGGNIHCITQQMPAIG